jgi:protein-disulfide isomerase
MARLTIPVSPADHADGAADAPLTLVEYGDYQCSTCGQAFPMIKEVQRVFGADLRFVFRHFPITELHPHALGAAAAAEAAARQDRFWPMHDLLFEHQRQLDLESLRGYAATLSLDDARFVVDLESAEVEARIRADFEGALASGVHGTPTFFVNGVRTDGIDYDTVVGALTAARPARRRR